jgi:hypothetical protein
MIAMHISSSFTLRGRCMARPRAGLLGLVECRNEASSWQNAPYRSSSWSFSWFTRPVQAFVRIGGEVGARGVLLLVVTPASPRSVSRHYLRS